VAPFRNREERSRATTYKWRPPELGRIEGDHERPRRAPSPVGLGLSVIKHKEAFVLAAATAVLTTSPPTTPAKAQDLKMAGQPHDHPQGAPLRLNGNVRSALGPAITRAGGTFARPASSSGLRIATKLFIRHSLQLN
jgi:hypothetical protein